MTIPPATPFVRALREMVRPSASSLLLAGATASLVGCAEGPTGDLELRVWGEAYVEEGIPAETFVDGWSVSYSAFVVEIRGIAAKGQQLDDGYVVDLAKPGGDGYGEGGFLLTTMQGVDAGGVGEIEWAIAHDHAHAYENLNAEKSDTDLMHYEGADILVSGTATRGSGATQASVTFTWTFASATQYHPCAATGEIPEGGVGVAQLTVHGERLFSDDLKSDEPNVAFDLIAQADADADGEVTREELEAVDISGHDRYQTGGQNIPHLWGFIGAQAKQVGHIDGEGHCETEPYDAGHTH